MNEDGTMEGWRYYAVEWCFLGTTLFPLKRKCLFETSHFIIQDDSSSCSFNFGSHFSDVPLTEVVCGSLRNDVLAI